MSGLNDFDLNRIVEPLQEWFQNGHRELPWRENPTPYYVWISEIMLQQTRVEAVKPYFDRFVQELPDVQALAEAREERLLKLWEGLGYYNRVRNLNAAAVQIMENYNGKLPDTFEELLNLKGIGHYTAGAIASIAYGKPVPAVDGNVLRVLSRVSADDSDIMKQSVRHHMEERLKEMMQENAAVRPSDFNQALMELGAMVCVPNGAPHCEACPWENICEAHQCGIELTLPIKKKAKARRVEKRTVLILKSDDTVGIRKRPNKGLLAGLYELPNVEGHLAREEALTLIKEWGYAPLHIQPLEKAKHIFSHVEWDMIGYAVKIEEPQEILGTQETPGTQKTLNTPALLFVNAEHAMETYAIPSAFAAYAEYMNIELGIKKRE